MNNALKNLFRSHKTTLLHCTQQIRFKTTTAFAGHHAFDNTITFYNYSTRDIHNQRVDFRNSRGKVCLVAVVDMANPNCSKYLKSLTELKETLKDKPFDLYVFPKSHTNDVKQFMVQTPVQSFLNSSPLTIMKETQSTYEAFDYLTNFSSSKTVVEAFEKFVIDKDGRVCHRSGSNTNINEVTDCINKQLDEGF